ncbi:ABC transporter permease [Clostridia bacterium]|nr:ABC transporter permease [Clostridia bacterium]
MRAYLAFTKKEFIENLRTYKLLILLAVFLLFGVMSPLVAKLVPEIMQNLGIGGIKITLPEATAMDSWVQFFKNVGQIGLLVLAVVFAGIMSNEFSRGTLVNVLTKGLKRHTVIFSKLTAAALIWTMSYLLCLAVTYGYTVYFWDMGELQHVFLAFFSMWLFGLLLVVLLILGGTLFKTFIGSLLLAGGAVVAMTLLNISPKIQKYNPVTLCGDNTALLTGVKNASDFVPAVIICIALVVVLTTVSVVVFDRKQI